MNMFLVLHLSDFLGFGGDPDSEGKVVCNLFEMIILGGSARPD